MATPASLATRRILLTRPADRGQGLASIISRAGGIAEHIPALEIVACELSEQDLAVMRSPTDFAAAFFISVNAVAFAARHTTLAAFSAIPVIAPGRATAARLRSAGAGEAILPEGRHDSEGMLQIPVLQTIRDNHVLIVRGHGGRDTLRAKLSERGARVRIVEVYERRLPARCAADLTSALNRGLDAVCVASGETLDNLLNAAGEQVPRLTRLPVFVPSQRVAALAAEAGFEHITVTRSPDDEGYAESLLAWADRINRHSE